MSAISQFINNKYTINLPIYLGPVHTNPFSNENGAVLHRFQKDLRPHLSFSYRFRPSTLQRRICLKTLLYPQCAWSNELEACAFQYIGSRNWRENEATWSRLSAILDTHGRVVLMASPFSNSIVFTVHTRKQRFQKASFANRSTLESVFEWLRFR